jgi:glutathione synthase/RimK-type ligase-like ATP-grasp enzyme
MTIRPRRDRQPSINWGLTDFGYEAKALPDGMLNRNIRTAVSKVQTFEKLAEASLPVPRWSKSYEELKGKLPQGRNIIARQDGLSGGKGMALVNTEVSTPFRSDFFVERLSCHREFRIHVFRGEVIHSQAKYVPHGFDGIARNWENGCFFTSEQLDRFANAAQLRDLQELATKSVEALKLDFGAVDLLLTKKFQPYILEVNTAPGLRTDATYAAYEGAVRKLYNL